MVNSSFISESFQTVDISLVIFSSVQLTDYLYFSAKIACKTQGPPKPNAALLTNIQQPWMKETTPTGVTMVTFGSAVGHQSHFCVCVCKLAAKQ